MLARIGSIILLLAAAPAVSHAQPCQDKPGAAIPDVRLERVASGFQDPVHVTGDGSSGRLYVVEQAGRIRVIANGQVLAEPFLDIRSKVESGGEKGLLSVAFHPKYRENGRFYIDYTTRQGGTLYTHVSELTHSATGGADPKSERVLLRIEQPYSNHNGGQLAFGPDGFLYIGMGDGGSANDPQGNGQNLSTLLGALLRIDVDQAAAPLPYAIPRDNPFVARAPARGEIYAYGLRNPWRFSFDAANGRLYLADVGQNAREEIDVIEKGGNYGWNIMEGEICTPSVNPRCDPSGLKPPIQTYVNPSQGNSVTGGFVYRGKRFPGLCGVYLYADYVTSRLWGLRYDGNRVTQQRQVFNTRIAISSFGQDDALELYVADHRGGRILRIVAP